MASIDINNYPGSKGGFGVSEFIINNIPDFKEFHEIFCGSSVIARKLYTSVENKIFHLSDLDMEVMDQVGKLFCLHHSNNELCLINNDGLSVFNKRAGKDIFIYADPPYTFSSRRSGRKYYNYEWNDQDHIEFLNYATRYDANIMISHYPCELYDKTLKDWYSKTFETVTRKGRATEKIWMNYDVDQLPLATYKYLGNDFTDRQRIKRRKKSYLNKFQSMPFHERMAILQHIQKNL